MGSEAHGETGRRASRRVSRLAVPVCAMLGLLIASPVAPAESVSTSGAKSPTLSVSPAAVAFGNVTVGGAGVTETLHVKNISGGPLTLGDLTVVDSSGAKTKLTNSPSSTCVAAARASDDWTATAGTLQRETTTAATGSPTQLAAGASCDFVETLTATTPGASTFTIDLGSSQTATHSNRPVAIPATATAVDAVSLSVSPAAVAFGNVTVGGAGVTETLHVKNISGGPLTLGDLTVVDSSGAKTKLTNSPSSTCVAAARASDDWTATAGTLQRETTTLTTGSPTQLAAGASCDFVETLTATTPGASTFTIDLGSSQTATHSNRPVAIPATATAVDAVSLSVSPAAVAFGNVTVGGAGVTETLHVKNISGGPLTLGDLTVVDSTGAKTKLTNSPSSTCVAAARASDDWTATAGTLQRETTTLTTGSPTQLAAGASCDFVETLTATTPGASTFTIDLGSSQTATHSNRPVAIPATATAVATGKKPTTTPKTGNTETSGLGSLTGATDCGQLSSMSSAFSQALTGKGSSDLDSRLALLQRYADKTPVAVRSDFKTVVGAYGEIATAVKGMDLAAGGVPSAGSIAKLEQLAQELEASNVTQAELAISQWAAKNCGG